MCLHSFSGLDALVVSWVMGLVGIFWHLQGCRLSCPYRFRLKLKWLRKALKLRFTISPRVIATEVQLDETLLMHTGTLAYFGLDPLGSKFWRAMQQTQHVDEVVSRVAAETDRSPRELEPILQAILMGMERSGLVTTTRD